MKHTIITCDLCNSRIYKDGWFLLEHGAISISAKTLKYFDTFEGAVYSHWKRRRYYICPKCIKKLKQICKGEKER